MAFLPTGSIAYELYIKDETSSICKTLKELGYTNIAIHPYYSTGWSRDKVYPLLGFDDFIADERNFPNAKYYRSYISDESSYDKVIEQFENKGEDEKLFVFNVTMQNHGGYASMYSNFPQMVWLEESSQYYAKTNQYLSLIEKSDEAFEGLLEYFSNVDEPTVIVMFGDHQPKIETEFYEELFGKSLDDLTVEEDQKRYITPFVIWANYDICLLYTSRCV